VQPILRFVRASRWQSSPTELQATGFTAGSEGSHGCGLFKTGGGARSPDQPFWDGHFFKIFCSASWADWAARIFCFNSEFAGSIFRAS
jgi:hypothetical protein